MTVKDPNKLSGKKAECADCGGRHTFKTEMDACQEKYANVRAHLTGMLAMQRNGIGAEDNGTGIGAALAQVAENIEKLERSRTELLDQPPSVTLPSPALDQYKKTAASFYYHCGGGPGYCAEDAAGGFPCPYHLWEWHREDYCVDETGRVQLRSTVRAKERKQINTHWSWKDNAMSVKFHNG